MKTAMAAAMTAAVAATSVSYMASMRWLKIKYEKARFDWLPHSLLGLKILHITDLHGNHPLRMNLDIWRAVFALDFDVAAITGDVIVNAADEILPHMPAIGRLAKRCPVFYVQGNHELLCFEEIKKILESAGVIVLNNEKQVWKIKGFGQFPIIGLRDYTEFKLGRFPETNALLRAHSGHFHLILSHQPQIFTRLKRLQLGLVIAGHTHGGQVRLPLAPVLYAPGQGVLPQYGDGWFEDGKNKMYISRGVGTTMFPIRLFNRPEITVLELTNTQSKI